MAEADLNVVAKLVDQASAPLRGLHGALGSVGGIAGTLTAPLGAVGSALGSVASIAGGFVVGQALTQLPGMLLDAAHAAAEEELGIARLQQAVDNAGGSWADQGDAIEGVIAQREKLGFADDKLRSSLAMLTAQTDSVDEAMDRQVLAMDLARGANIDLETASKLLGKVTDENVNVLARYGIRVEKGATATELFAAVQAKFGGQAAKAAQTAAVQWEIFGNQMANLKEDIGSALLPVFTKLGSMMVQGVDALRQSGALAALTSGLSAAAEAAGDLMAAGLELAQQFGPPLMAAFQALRGALETIFGLENTDSLQIGLEKLFGIDSPIVEQAMDMVFGVGDAIQHGAQLISDSWNTIVQVFQGDWSPDPGQIDPFTEAVGEAALVIRDQVIPAIQQFGAFLTGTVLPAVQQFVGFIQANWQPILAAAGAVILAAIVPGFVAWAAAAATAAAATLLAIAPLALLAAAVGLLVAAWVNDWGGIQETTQAVWAVVQPIIEAVIAEVGRFATEMAPLAIAAWQNISTLVGMYVTALGAVVQAVVGALVAFWTENHATIQQVAELAWTAISNIVQAQWALLSGVIQAGLQILSGDWSGAWQTMQTTLDNVWAHIRAAVGPAWAAISGAIQAAIEGVVSWAADAGGRLVSAFANGIRQKAGEALAAVQNMVQQARDLLPHSDAKLGPLADLTNAGRMLPTTFGAGITAAAGAAVGAAAGVAQQVMDRFKLVMPPIQQAGEKAGDAFASVLEQFNVQLPPVQEGLADATDKMTDLSRATDRSAQSADRAEALTRDLINTTGKIDTDPVKALEAAWKAVLKVLEDSNSELTDFLDRLRALGQIGNGPAAAPLAPEAAPLAVRAGARPTAGAAAVVAGPSSISVSLELAGAVLARTLVPLLADELADRAVI